MKVDIVYRWINPNIDIPNPVFNADNKTAQTRRLRDNRELAYSVKSLKYLPYINKIYVIAKGCSKWNDAPDNLIWIREEEYNDIFTKDDDDDSEDADSGEGKFYLVPEESERSKYIIPLLPDLSEFFILMDDDYYFAKETPFDYFFKKIDEHAIFMEGSTPVVCSYKPIWPDKVLLSHCPIPMTKTLYIDCINNLSITPIPPKKGDRQVGSFCGIKHYTNKKVAQKRFKFDPLICMQLYLLASDKIITKQLNHILIWGKNFRSYKKIFNNILEEKPNTVAINDNWSINIEEYNKQMIEYDLFRNKMLNL